MKVLATLTAAAIVTSAHAQQTYSDKNQRGCVEIVTAVYGEYDPFYDWRSWCRVIKHEAERSGELARAFCYRDVMLRYNRRRGQRPYYGANSERDDRLMLEGCDLLLAQD